MHLFPVTLFTWIFSNLLLRKRHAKAVYWTGATLLSLVGAVGMASAFANPDIPLTARYVFVPQVIGILVFGVEMAVLGVLRRLGFIAALSTRLGFYSVWHVIWPLVFY